MTAWHSVFWSASKHRWLVRIGTDGSRTQRQLTVPQEVALGPKARKAAELWASEQLGSKNAMDGKKVPTLAELTPVVIELWKQDERIAAKTRADRISFVRNHILPAFGTLTIDEIATSIVRAWVRTMRKRGDARSSIGNRLSALSTLLSDLHAEGKGPDNRVATAKAVLDELPATKKKTPVALELEAFSKLIWSSNVPFWFRLLAALAGLAGLEAGAALGLEVRDIVIVDGRPVALRVRQSVAILGPDGYASIGPTKNEHRGTNEHPRILPVHPALATLLVEWLEVERERWCCHVARPNDLLVPSAAAKPWRPKVADRLRRELAGLGIDVPEGLVFHRLRGCFATWLAAAGVPKDQRQRLMGHAGDVEGEHYEVAGALFETDFEAVARIAVEVVSGRDKGAGTDRDNQLGGNQTGRTLQHASQTTSLVEMECRGRGNRHNPGLDRDCASAENVTVAVPFAVPCDDSSAQQVCKTPSNQGAPGRNRTCDQRFRNARALCTYEHVCTNDAAQTSPKRHKSSGAASDNGLDLGAAVPDAVRGARDGLRWTTLSWDGAEAMLAGLEDAP